MTHAVTPELIATFWQPEMLAAFSKNDTLPVGVEPLTTATSVNGWLSVNVVWQALLKEVVVVAFAGPPSMMSGMPAVAPVPASTTATHVVPPFVDWIEFPTGVVPLLFMIGGVNTEVATPGVAIDVMP